MTGQYGGLSWRYGGLSWRLSGRGSVIVVVILQSRKPDGLIYGGAFEAMLQPEGSVASNPEKCFANELELSQFLWFEV
jgi:hypothetical protein